MPAYLLSAMLTADIESQKRAKMSRMQNPSILQHRGATGKLALGPSAGRHTKWARPGEKELLSTSGWTVYS